MDRPLPLTELHWLAGLLEGEGSFMTGPPSSPGLPVIAVNMTDHDVMARIGQIFERKVAGAASVKSVAERFGVSVWCIYDLRLGRTFKHLARERIAAPSGYQPP